VNRAVRVPDEAAGWRLDRFLAGLPEVATRAVAERLVGAGTVTVDGAPRPKSHKLEGGEEVAFEVPEAKAVVYEQIDVPLAYEDEHLLVVDKPAGLVVHPGAGRSRGTLVHALHGRIAGGDDPERPGIVHRLDRDTSGLMVVARTQETYERLQQLVRARELERGYVALVKGRPRSRRGTIDAPIGRDRFEATRQSLDSETPRDAVTHFELEGLLREFAFRSSAIRPTASRTSAWGASSCTPARSRSTTRSPASGSSWQRRYRPICSGFSTPSARLGAPCSFSPAEKAGRWCRAIRAVPSSPRRLAAHINRKEAPCQSSP
jgi:23S rRNA pseudouridine1911/1915/1917 synthase